MDKHLPHAKLYSFRSRMMTVLYVCTVVASLISLIFAYIISHLNVQQELKLQQQAIAVYLLEMEQRTELPLHVMLHMVESSQLSASALETDGSALPEGVMEMLLERTIHTVPGTLTDTPVTYVLLENNVVRINALQGRSLFVVAFFRVIFSSISYIAVFVLILTYAAFHLSKPVHELTQATSCLEEGDFDVHLPENTPGELGTLMRSFNSMTEALGRNAYLQKDFISSISHEFKTPIASIRGFAKLLQMPGITEEQRSEYIALIAQESDRLSRLSETLLRLTALEQQARSDNVSAFALDEQIRQVILRQEPLWSAKDIEWQLELEGCSIRSDEALMSHVWVNLIQNAVKFSPEGATIEIRLTKTDGAVVKIEDHGCGMDEETCSRIFDRFYQADKSHQQEGVGLGLCLVKRILDLLGGSVTVRSTPGLGSTFRVQLPAQPPHHTRMEELPHA